MDLRSNNIIIIPALADNVRNVWNEKFKGKEGENWPFIFNLKIIKYFENKEQIRY